MIKEAFGTGTTIVEAFEAATKALSAPEGVEVKTEIIETPKKKIFGLFGSTVTKARAYYEYDDKPTVEFRPNVKPVKNQEKKQEAAKASKVSAPPVVPNPKEEIKTLSTDFGFAEDYLKAILHGLNIDDVTIKTEESDETISFQIDCGQDYGSVIGHRGETLDAIQYLTRLLINKGKNDYKRVSINVGNYREKRAKTLSELAAKNASKVIKYGKNVVLEPMNPYERRVIHTAVQQIENVESYSIGNDDTRRVVIKLCEGVQATNPGSGNYRNRDNRGSGSGNKGGGYKGNHSKPSSAPKRTNEAPKSDVSSASLYGKIEPKNK